MESALDRDESVLRERCKCKVKGKKIDRGIADTWNAINGKERKRKFKCKENKPGREERYERSAQRLPGRFSLPRLRGLCESCANVRAVRMCECKVE